MKTKVPSAFSDDCATEAQDLQKINVAADWLNAEAEDVLEYQAEDQTKDATHA
ncbi:MAG TPA: hypothetical protein VH079_04645 [Terriglobales bacterium]|nr:hypothetical protein [Terriglobales bacterium]